MHADTWIVIFVALGAIGAGLVAVKLEQWFEAGVAAAVPLPRHVYYMRMTAAAFAAAFAIFAAWLLFTQDYVSALIFGVLGAAGFLGVGILYREVLQQKA